MKEALTIKCNWCPNNITVIVKVHDYQDWINGKLIQKAMPYLTPTEREMLISGTCETCFNKMFPKKEK